MLLKQGAGQVNQKECTDRWPILRATSVADIGLASSFKGGNRGADPRLEGETVPLEHPPRIQSFGETWLLFSFKLAVPATALLVPRAPSPGRGLGADRTRRGWGVHPSLSCGWPSPAAIHIQWGQPSPITSFSYMVLIILPSAAIMLLLIFLLIF